MARALATQGGPRCSGAGRRCARAPRRSRALAQQGASGVPGSDGEDWRTFRARLVANEAHVLGRGHGTKSSPQDGKHGAAGAADAGAEKPEGFDGARWAHSLSRPEAGGLLLAREDLDGGWFGRSVVLLFEHRDTEGTMGVILNRPTRATLGQLVQNLPVASKLARCKDLPVNLGGPVDTSSLLAVSSKNVQGARRIVDGMYVLGINDAADALCTGDIAPRELHLFMGYSGWAPHQLKSEIDHGGWWCGAADASSVLVPSRCQEGAVPAVGSAELLENESSMWEDLKARIGH